MRAVMRSEHRAGLETPLWKPTRHNTGEGCRRRGRDENRTLRFHRGSGDSTCGSGSTWNKGSLPGARDGQRPIREDQGRPRQMAEGPVRALTRGNARRAKGPYFRTSVRSDESQEIGP